MNKSLTEEQLRNVVYNTIRESISELSPEFLRKAGNKAIEKGREGYGKYGSYSEIPAGTPEYKKYMQGDRMLGRAKELEKEEINLTESELKEHIFNSIKQGLQNFMDKNYYGFLPKDIANPQVKDVIEQNGWEILKTKQTQDGGMLYQISQITGAFANTDGSLNLDELVKDINLFMNGNHCRIMKRQNQFTEYSDAENAIIYIK